MCCDMWRMNIRHELYNKAHIMENRIFLVIKELEVFCKQFSRGLKAYSWYWYWYMETTPQKTVYQICHGCDVTTTTAFAYGHPFSLQRTVFRICPGCDVTTKNTLAYDHPLSLQRISTNALDWHVVARLIMLTMLEPTNVRDRMTNLH